MANRRMFSRDITDADDFVELSFAAQALYFHLGMAADDDGFVSSPKRIARAIGACEDDLNELEKHGFLIRFPNTGIYVITHFLVNNQIRSDRYHATIYQSELSMLRKDETGMYSICQPSDNQADTIQQPDVNQKEATVQPDGNTGESSFISRNQNISGEWIPPTLEEVKAFCEQEGLKINPEKWYRHYQSVNWVIGNNRMANWHASVLKWNATESEEKKPETKKIPAQQYSQRDYEGEQEAAMRRQYEEARQYTEGKLA